MLLSRRALPLVLGAAAAASAAALAYGGEVAQSADVTRYGARGDGVSDDSAAIQAAIDSGAALVFFPAGRYLCRRPLVPRSNQTWRGEGMAASLLVQPADDPPSAPFNLMETLGVVEDVTISDLGFVGNGRRHTERGGDGQRGFAVYIRGLQRRLCLSRCRFAGFGGGRSGGGVVLGPRPDSDPQGLEDITVTDCVFEDNGNVAGLYLAGGSQPAAVRRNIRVLGNRFGGVRPKTRPQNCVYILSDGAETRIANVLVSDNLFDIADSADACIELNWVDGFTISGNSIAFAGAVRGSSGVLLRDGCRGGTVTGNSLRDASADQVVAIDLQNFADPGTIEDVTITGNTIHGFTWRGIAVDRGARGVVVTGNRVTGGERRLAEALRIVDARDVLVSGNAVSGAATAVMLASGDGAAAGVRTVTISGNQFTGCGGDGPLIAVQPGCDVRGLIVDGNRVAAPLPGTTAVAGGAFASPEGNLIGRNQTAGLAEVVPGEESGWTPFSPGLL